MTYFYVDSYSSEEEDSDVSDQQKILHTTEKKPSSSLALTLNSSKLRIAMFPRAKVGIKDFKAYAWCSTGL